MRGGHIRSQPHKRREKDLYQQEGNLRGGKKRREEKTQDPGKGRELPAVSSDKSEKVGPTAKHSPRR